MNDPDAYQLGIAAFHQGADRLSCPWSAPYNPPRTAADARRSVRTGGTIGAFWLDGFEAARDAAKRRVTAAKRKAKARGQGAIPT